MSVFTGALTSVFKQKHALSSSWGRNLERPTHAYMHVANISTNTSNNRYISYLECVYVCVCGGEGEHKQIGTDTHKYAEKHYY